MEIKMKLNNIKLFVFDLGQDFTITNTREIFELIKL